jgi:hypothetical protein
MTTLKFQRERENPHKPAVTNEGGIWWARVIDLNNEYHGKLHFSHSEALAKAYELAALVERQRAELEPTA